MRIRGEDEITKAELQTQRNEDQSEVTTLKKEVQQYKQKNEYMSGVMARMCKTVSKMENRISMLEQTNMQRSFVLTGFNTQGKKPDKIQQIQDFIQDEVLKDAEVEDIFFMGEKEPRNVVVTVTSLKQKHQIMQEKMKLKELVNEDGKSVLY